MNKELDLHIKKLQRRATLSLIALLSTIILIGFGMLFLFVPSFVAIIFFVVAAVCVIFLIHSGKTAKREEQEAIFKPVILNADKKLTFDQIVSIFYSLTDEKNRLSTSEDVLFFRLNRILQFRAVIYRTGSFTKKDFDNAKGLINKKANKVLAISQRVRLMESGKMMRLNIICTDTLNDELYRILSENACRNLTRAEGVINVAIVGNQIIIPPLYGQCDSTEISRYKAVIIFISRVLLSNSLSEGENFDDSH